MEHAPPPHVPADPMEMPTGLVVRAATALDRAAAARLLGAHLAEEGTAGDPDGVARAVELSLAQGSNAWLVIALVRGLPAGVLLANPAVSVSHGGAALRLEALYVSPERRGRGIEGALVDFVVDEARLSGMRAVEAEAAGAAGESQLEGCGFAPIARRRFSRSI